MPDAQGVARVLGFGTGNVYTVKPTDTAVRFQASHDLGNSATATVEVFLHSILGGGVWVSAAAIPITNTPPALAPYTIPLTAFANGGSISVGATIDGYALKITGAMGSDIVLDTLEIIGTKPPCPPPVLPAPVRPRK